TSIRRRRRACGHAGIAALWDQGHAVLRGELDDVDDLFRRRGCEDRRRGPMHPPPPIGQPRLDLGTVGDYGLWTEPLLSLRDHLRLSVHGGGAWHERPLPSKWRNGHEADHP